MIAITDSIGHPIKVGSLVVWNHNHEVKACSVKPFISIGRVVKINPKTIEIDAICVTQQPQKNKTIIRAKVDNILVVDQNFETRIAGLK